MRHCIARACDTPTFVNPPSLPRSSVLYNGRRRSRNSSDGTTEYGGRGRPTAADPGTPRNNHLAINYVGFFWFILIKAPPSYMYSRLQRCTNTFSARYVCPPWPRPASRRAATASATNALRNASIGGTSAPAVRLRWTRKTS